MSDEVLTKRNKITYSKDNVSLGHTGINIIAGDKAPGFAYSSNLNNLDTDILGDYIRDDSERRIFRPKIN